MTQLINKGGFRERANRSRKYKDSENEKTMLVSNKYQPSVKPESHLNNTSSVDIQPDSIEIKDINP
ncbi:hypothetical protein D7V21_04215 [Acinetobacter guerrae]|uniref:Uncharacterized protein n=1 Tax=Acinetobacter guerrae TaxID=1843371 RepID=A0A3A8EKS4_9GAMM|nr:hypothetical protein [Acinetobacter guerrae]RKG35517.1 hypothetical protein D7V21_04215 [Acinetobacter guerrae]